MIGGTHVFALFLDLYDVFHLTRAPEVRLPGGRPVFGDVPARTPEAVLASHGLVQWRRRLLDRAKGLWVEIWRRGEDGADGARGANSAEQRQSVRLGFQGRERRLHLSEGRDPLKYHWALAPGGVVSK